MNKSENRMFKENQVCKYWRKRAAEHGAKAISFGNKPLDHQSRLHRKRANFIFRHCPCSLRTIDFGCGTGNFADRFESYLGMDINKKFLSFAKKRYPEKDFILLKKPIPLKEAVFLFKPELFFSTTVLQHNPDSLIRKIFKSMAQYNQNMIFCLYENSHVGEDYHIKGRTPKDYLMFLKESYEILNAKSFSHYIHRQKHSIVIVKAKPLSMRKK